MDADKMQNDIKTILKTVKDYMCCHYKVIGFDGTCAKCYADCEFNIVEGDNGSWEREGDEPIFYSTPKGKHRITLDYLVERNINFNDARLMQKHSRKLKQELQAEGLQVSRIGLYGLVCARGKSLRITVIVNCP